MHGAMDAARGCAQRVDARATVPLMTPLSLFAAERIPQSLDYRTRTVAPEDPEVSSWRGKYYGLNSGFSGNGMEARAFAARTRKWKRPYGKPSDEQEEEQ